jgi:hypothetical protein
MQRVLLRSVAAIALLSLAGAGPNGSDAPPDKAIVVTGQRMPIVINGRSVRCRPLANDPQDLWRPANPSFPNRSQSILLPQVDGLGFKLADDSEQLGGQGVWRRVGTGIDQYVFRVPMEASLLCIGAKTKYPAGYGQLRQILDAKPYRGHRIRFTAWTASRNAARVNFWLASADPNADWATHAYGCTPLLHNARDPHRGCIYDGGNSNGIDWHGSHGWTPVLLEIGPISKLATIISFGFVLNGSGNVWLYNPKIEVVPPDDPYQRKGDVYVIGTDRNGSGSRTAADH